MNAVQLWLSHFPLILLSVHSSPPPHTHKHMHTNITHARSTLPQQQGSTRKGSWCRRVCAQSLMARWHATGWMLSCQAAPRLLSRTGVPQAVAGSHHHSTGDGAVVRRWCSVESPAVGPLMFRSCRSSSWGWCPGGLVSWCQPRARPPLCGNDLCNQRDTNTSALVHCSCACVFVCA